HTNHMIMRPTCELPCDAESVKKSSLARYETISKDLAKHRGTELTVAFCLDALSSHVGKPYSPCRHPSGNVKGKTVAAAVFDIKAGKMTLYRGNPCTSVKAGNCKMYIYNELK
ncbi:MAG: hypothetical protein KAS23_06345, partial [Anaerohalosphaera sp.]|nr:hypothetical protein [Anaerohalosphaera sp.]